MTSLEKACAKRPVSIDALERLADRLEKRAQEFGETEVESRRLGEWILTELAVVDPMAGARFASVFRRFEGAADYDAFFRSLGTGAEAESSTAAVADRGTPDDADT